MTAYRKKPVVIEAWKIDHDSEQPEWVKAEFRAETLDWCPSGEGLWINTLEGCMVGSMGDMLIRGIKGEFYACKPDIFEATYELATHPQAPAFPQPEAEAQPFTYEGSHTAADGTVTHVSGEAQKAVAEPNWNHPRLQSLLGREARHAIEGRMIEEVLNATTLEALDEIYDNDYETVMFDRIKDLKRSALENRPSAGAPLPEQRQCIAADPLCPCQDGDTCHYEGRSPFPLPSQRQEAAQVEAIPDTLLHWADSIDPMTRKAPPDNLTLGCAAKALRALATPPASSRVAAPTPQAVKVPLTDDELWRFWWSRPEVPDGEDDSMEAEFVKAVRAILAAHDIYPTEGERSHD